MENSNYFNQFQNFLTNTLGSSQVTTEIQLKSTIIPLSTPQITFPSFTNYFHVSHRTGPLSLTEVTVTEVRKTEFLTATSTLDRLLPFHQDHSGSFRGGESKNYRDRVLPSDHQNSLFSRGGATQEKRPVPKIEPITGAEFISARDLSPPPGFSNKNGLGSASVNPIDYVLPSHQDSLISRGGATHNKLPVPKTEPNTGAEFNLARDVPPPGFSNKNGLGSARVKPIDLNEEYYESDGGDGRIHSLPHQKNGPYKCPRCFENFPTSQHYAAHISSHHRSETLAQKKKRHVQKFKNRKFKTVQTPDGLTVVPDQSSNPIDDQVDVVLRDKGQNGVVLHRQIRSVVREGDEGVIDRFGISQPGKGHLDIKELRTREELVDVMKGVSVLGRGESHNPSPEFRKKEGPGCSSDRNRKRVHEEARFGDLKRKNPC